MGHEAGQKAIWLIDRWPVHMMYLFTTVPHPHGHWQLKELLGNQCWAGIPELDGVKTPWHSFTCYPSKLHWCDATPRHCGPKTPQRCFQGSVQRYQITKFREAKATGQYKTLCVFKMSVIKPSTPMWLYIDRKRITNDIPMVRKGWVKCGLICEFEPLTKF